MLACSTFFPLYWTSIGFSQREIATLEANAYLFSLVGLLLLLILNFKVKANSKLPLSGLSQVSFLLFFLLSPILVLSSHYVIIYTIFALVLICLSVVNALVPILSLQMIKDAASQTGLNFGEEYGAYRKFGSIGFMFGLLLCGFCTDIISPSCIPFFLGLGGLFAFIFIRRANPCNPYKDANSLGGVTQLFSLIPFLCFQLFVWAGFCVFFRYLILRMSEMGCSSLEIALSNMLLGVINFTTVGLVGKLSDGLPYRFLAIIVILFTSLRVWVLGIPETSYIGFYLIQFLHVPTWILNDIISMRYLKDMNSKFGAINISVMNQCALTLGMVLGSYVMSRLLISISLKESFFYAAMLPFLALPFIFSSKIKA